MRVDLSNKFRVNKEKRIAKMGCDIHLFMEYKRKDGKIWFNFGEEFSLNGNYFVFAFLAGVRNEHFDLECNFKPKGLPKDVSWETLRHFVYKIGREDNPYVIPRICTKETANEFIRYGSYIIDNDYISHPDYHSETWLSYDEYTKLFDFKFKGKK